MAQHRLGLVAQASKNYGEAVARMKVSCLPIYTTCMVSVHMHILTYIPPSLTLTLTHPTLTPSQKALELLHDAERRGEGNFKAYVSVTG